MNNYRKQNACGNCAFARVIDEYDDFRVFCMHDLTPNCDSFGFQWKGGTYSFKDSVSVEAYGICDDWQPDKVVVERRAQIVIEGIQA